MKKKQNLPENKFELLIEQVGDAFFIIDYDGYIIDVNDNACKSLGYSCEELTSMNISEIDVEGYKCKT